TSRPHGRADSAAPVIVISRLPCVAGRHPGCDHLIPDSAVSRFHCAFFLREGRVWVEDLRSSNGTSLNGKPLTAAEPVADGDWLHIGRRLFQIRLAGVTDIFRRPARGPCLGER